MFTRLRKRIIRSPRRNMSVPNIAPASVEFTEGILEEEEEERQVADREEILKVYRSQSMQIAAEEMGESLRSITENTGLVRDEPFSGAQATMESPRHVSCSIADADFSTWRARNKITNKPLSSASQPPFGGDMLSRGRPVAKALESELTRCYQRRKTWEEKELQAARRRSSIQEQEIIPAPQLKESTANLDELSQSVSTCKDPEGPPMEPPTPRNSFLNWRQKRSTASSKIQFDAGGADDPLVDFEIELGDGRRIQRWKSYDKMPANLNKKENETPAEESRIDEETKLERMDQGSDDNRSEDNLTAGIDDRNSQSNEKAISQSTGPKLSRRQRLIETQSTTSLSLSLMSRSGAPPQRQDETSSTSSFGKRWSLVEVYRAARRQKEERLETLRRSRKESDLKGDMTDVQRAEDLIAKCTKCPSQSLEALEDGSGDTESGATKKFDISDHTASTEESTEAT